MQVLVAGGTGFIGAALCRRLAARGHRVVILTRRPDPPPQSNGLPVVSWGASRWQQLLEECDGLVNLAGESITGKRWSTRQKLLIRESRVETTRRLVSAVAVLPKKPGVLVNASAVGFYGPREDEELDEADAPGHGFLAELCQAWEHEACRAEPLGVRVVRLRIGIVLGLGGGALSKMVPPFRAFLGGPLGSGRQWMSWIHLDDVAGLIEWALTHAEVSGAVNATAPHPVTMHELSQTLGRVLHRPSVAPIPGVVLRLALGEMADMLLTGQRVLPKRAVAQGYAFRYPLLQQALEDCLGFVR